jgi:hypothetical protein
MLEMVLRFSRGVDCENKLLNGYEALVRVGPGGSFIEDSVSLREIREEDIYSPELFSWSGHKDASMNALEKAKEKAEKLAAIPSVADKEKLMKLKECMEKIKYD